VERCTCCSRIKKKKIIIKIHSFYFFKSKNIKIYAVKIDPLINTNPIITYKVIIPSLNKLEQGNMFTGIFRSSENS